MAAMAAWNTISLTEAFATRRVTLVLLGGHDVPTTTLVTMTLGHTCGPE
jgi:hypothetical protein